MAYTSDTHPFYCRYISATENLPIILRVSVVDSPLATVVTGISHALLPTLPEWGQLPPACHTHVDEDGISLRLSHLGLF